MQGMYYSPLIYLPDPQTLYFKIINYFSVRTSYSKITGVQPGKKKIKFTCNFLDKGSYKEYVHFFQSHIHWDYGGDKSYAK